MTRSFEKNFLALTANSATLSVFHGGHVDRARAQSDTWRRIIPGVTPTEMGTNQGAQIARIARRIPF